MIKIGIQTDITKAISHLENVRVDQVPFAVAKALTATAQEVKKALEKEMRTVFDRPTPYTMRSLFLAPATKRKLEARVWLRDFGGKGTPATKYLLPQIEGGARRHKRFERALAAVGLLPGGMYVVPGSAAKIDAYGNMARGQIVQIMSALKASEVYAGFQANRTARSAKRKGRRLAEYFVGAPGGNSAQRIGDTPTGIWQRFSFGFGSAVKPVAIFTRSPVYQVRFHFNTIAEKVVLEQFSAQFNAAYAVAVATAR